MSIEPGKKPSLLAALADEYDLDDAEADRLIAKIQSSVAQDAAAGSSSASSSADVARGTGLGKLLLVGASCLALATVGAFTFYGPSKTEPVVTEGTSIGSGPARAEDPAREAQGSAGIPSVSVDSLPSVAPASAPAPSSQGTGAKASPVMASSSASGAGSADTLGRETQLITSARAALNAGNAEKALALLDEHARLFPNGWLANDRKAERIVVLCSVGRRTEAAREAKAFLDGRPASPLTRRVEASCAGESPTRAGGR